MLPGPAVPGCCLISFHFLCAIHPIRPVVVLDSNKLFFSNKLSVFIHWCTQTWISVRRQELRDTQTGPGRLRLINLFWLNVTFVSCHMYVTPPHWGTNFVFLYSFQFLLNNWLFVLFFLPNVPSLKAGKSQGLAFTFRARLLQYTPFHRIWASCWGAPLWVKPSIQLGDKRRPNDDWDVFPTIVLFWNDVYRTVKCIFIWYFHDLWKLSRCAGMLQHTQSPH